MAERGLLERMATESHARAQALRGRSAALHQAAVRSPEPLPAPRTGVIAELKRRAPSYGLAPEEQASALLPSGGDLGTQIEAYVAGGAAALSVLTEPTAFGGCRYGFVVNFYRNQAL